MQRFSASLPEMFASLWRHKQLIFQMSKREVIGRYRGSVMGIAWSFLNPLFMLVVYTFVFSVVFKARWGLGENETQANFAVILFAGLIVHNLLAECVNRAPSLILSNPNYVKKVIFPLEILPWVALGASLFHTVVSFFVLLLAQAVLAHTLQWTALLFPLVILPILLMTLGAAWFLAALGVYLRDIGQVTTMLTTILLFISAIFFPVTALPERYQFWVRLNPLAFIVEASRDVLIFGKVPDPMLWLATLLGGFLIAWGGFACFQKMRRGFADVL